MSRTGARAYTVFAVRRALLYQCAVRACLMCMRHACRWMCGAVGVMLFQMLYGRRPFGEGCSQEEILREEVMLKAKAVAFPAKPAVSTEAKEFIGRCAPHVCMSYEVCSLSFKS